MQKAFQWCVRTHFIPEVHVQAQEVVGGFIKSQTEALQREMLSRGHQQENKQQPECLWLQGTMANTSKFAHHPSVHCEWQQQEP